jgi:hypothetical protein
MFPPPSETKDLMISEYNFGQSMTQRDCLTFILWEFNFRFFMVSCWCYSLGNQVGLSSVICLWHWCSVINIISIFSNSGFSYMVCIPIFNLRSAFVAAMYKASNDVSHETLTFLSSHVVSSAYFFCKLRLISDPRLS